MALDSTSRDAEIREPIASTTQVAGASGREPRRKVLVRLTGGHWPQQHGWPVVPRLAMTGQDTALD